jgi:hypothetical protein
MRPFTEPHSSHVPLMGADDAFMARAVVTQEGVERGGGGKSVKVWDPVRGDERQGGFERQDSLPTAGPTAPRWEE